MSESPISDEAARTQGKEGGEVKPDKEALCRVISSLIANADERFKRMVTTQQYVKGRKDIRVDVSIRTLRYALHFLNPNDEHE